ncbi:MAG: Hsp20/alpha crystallin family protein [Cyclobacteriaceae bacterium]
MALYRRRNTVFDRIGNRYGSFIDSDHFLGRNAFDENWMTSPVMNVRKNHDHYDLEIGLPGYDKNDISISVHDRTLEVVAEKDLKKDKASDDEYVQKEIDTNSVKKTFQLSSLIDMDKIDSTYENGLLRIRLPRIKKRESAQAIKVA